MPRDPEALFEMLERGDIPPVLAIGGAERVYVDDVLALVRKQALAGGMADFNHDRVSARDKKAAQIVSLARTLPVMSKRRLVEVKDADQLRDDDLDILEEYCARPSPESVLLLLFGDIDLRDKLPKLLDKKAALCRFDHPKEREMPVHIRRRAKRHELKLDGRALDALAATVGADLTLLERALEKLALVANNGVVDEGAIAAHVADTHLEDAFAFARSVALADRKSAMQALGALQAAREEPLRIVGLLAWQLRQIARARALLDDNRDAARELNLFGDRLSTTMTAAKKLDSRGHGARLARLAKSDRLLKGSRQAPWLVMAKLVLDLCPPPPRANPNASARR
ncbi:MAG TPA: DNA polymerase III subunit delta [Myxococcota bacterium]|jgi:DNA polymerase-3 subunit delta